MKYFFLLLLIALLAGCEKTVNIDLPKETPKLVVNSYFTPDSVVSVQVSTSYSVLARPVLNGVTDAVVKLFEEGREVATLKQDTSLKFVYVSDSKKLIQAGKKYAVSVTAPPYQTATAQSFVPFGVKINKATITESAGVSVDGGAYNLLRLEISDPANTENYYGIKVKKQYYKMVRNNQTGRQDTLWGESIANVFLEPSINSVNPGKELLYSDKLFNGQLTNLLLYYFPSVPDGFKSLGVFIILTTASKEYYEYNKRVSTHVANQTFEILGGETVPMPNNIINGYGIFAGYTSDQVFKSL